MQRFSSIVLLASFAAVVLSCSGNAVVEPAALTSKRAKAFLEKCQPPAPPDGVGELKEVYACIEPEEICPEPSDPMTATELGYALNKGGECEGGTAVYDVPCGPDLNAIACCYVVRMKTFSVCQ